MPLVICIVSRGRLKGKTSLIEELTTKFLGEGFRIATVKHIHGLFDTVEKDTYRHLKAGATIVVASTPTEIVTIRRPVSMSFEEALKSIYIKTDLVLVEGYKSSLNPKILCTETAFDAKSAIKDIPNIVMVSGSIVYNDVEKEKFRQEFPEIGIYNLEDLVLAIKEMLCKDIVRNLPGLNCGHCSYDTCFGFTKAVLNGDVSLEDCEVLSSSLITLKIDGEVIHLSKFPQEILRGIILGALKSLKDVSKNPKEIDISIKVD
jgi:molybdopterin-guanine dinucleotide biosynthesis protein B